MSIIPALTPKQMLNILLKAGFKILRQKGSHIRLEHPITKRATSIPFHVKELSRGLIYEIRKQTGLSLKEFLRLLGK